MEIQIGGLARHGMDLHNLILDYYAKTNAQDGIPPLRMDWGFFGDLERLGRLVTFVALEDDKLVGVAMYILGVHPQHDRLPFATCNTLAVAVEHRGKGIATQLVNAAEAYFKDTPVKMIVHGFRTIYNAEPLFPKLGFNLVEHTYMKVL